MNGNLFQLFCDRVAEPGKICIETAGGERYSYADLIELSGRMARALSELGVGPGDRVAVQVEKSTSQFSNRLAVNDLT
jgi:malonyl-CoA/methylmalonyl-CoA synthetase